MVGGEHSSSSERDRERFRRARLVAGANVAAHGMQVLSQLLVVPIALTYLGTERFGLWMALLSIVAIAAFADFGLGAGLQNAIAECVGRGDRSGPRRYLSSAFFMLVGLAVLLVYLAIWLLPSLPLLQWLNVRGETARQEVLPACQALLICIAIGLPAGLVTRVYNGFQEGYVPKMWIAVGRLLALGGVLLCVSYGFGLPWMAAVYTGAPFILLALGGHALLWKRPWLVPSLSAVDRSAIARITGTGIPAFAVQISLVLATSGIPLIIAAQFGAEALPPFAVTQRFLWLPTMMVGVLVYPLWPAYREALARGDRAFLRAGWQRSLKQAALIQLPFVGIMLLWGQDIILFWTGQAEVVPDPSLLYALCAWSILTTFSMVCMILLFGWERFAGQAVYALLTALAALVTCYYQAASWGPSGIAWGLVLICGLPRALFYGLEVWVQMRRLRAE